MNDCIEEYHRVFPKAMHVVIVDGTFDKIRTIIEAFDTCYENNYKIHLLSNETQFEELLNEEYIDTVKRYPMTVEELCSGLQRYASLLGFSKEREEYTIYIVGLPIMLLMKLKVYQNMSFIKGKQLLAGMELRMITV